MPIKTHETRRPQRCGALHQDDGRPGRRGLALHHGDGLLRRSGLVLGRHGDVEGERAPVARSGCGGCRSPEPERRADSCLFDRSRHTAVPFDRRRRLGSTSESSYRRECPAMMPASLSAPFGRVNLVRLIPWSIRKVRRGNDSASPLRGALFPCQGLTARTAYGVAEKRASGTPTFVPGSLRFCNQRCGSYSAGKTLKRRKKCLAACEVRPGDTRALHAVLERAHAYRELFGHAL